MRKRKEHKEQQDKEKKEKIRKTGMKMTMLGLVFLGLAYVSVPLYRVFCASTGYGLSFCLVEYTNLFVSLSLLFLFSFLCLLPLPRWLSNY